MARRQPSSWQLRRHDQATIAALAALALVALAVGWWYQGGSRGQLVNVEAQPHKPVSFLVDINVADWPELAQLPGLGETLARRVVRSRQEEGPFGSHDALRRVTGLGPKKLAQIKPFLLPIGPQAEPSLRPPSR